MNEAHIINGHGYELKCDAQYGGRINSLTYQGIPILRPTLDLNNGDPLQSACFPLVPFSNRIRNGKFIFNEIAYELAANWNGDQPVIHGEAWQKPWNIVKHAPNSIIMRYVGENWWPWEYEAQLYFTLLESGLELSLAITNRSNSTMPAGLGFHPYFPRLADTRMQFQSSAIWPPMGDNPLQRIDAQHLSFNERRNINDYSLDHCFEKLNGDIIINQPSLGLDVRMASVSGLNHSVVFIPEEKTDFFCVEPVSHITGAIGFDNIGSIAQVAVGDTLSSRVRISATLRDQ